MDLEDFLNSLPSMEDTKVRGSFFKPEDTKERYERNSKLTHEERIEKIKYLQDDRTPEPPYSKLVDAIAIDINGVELFNGKYRYYPILRTIRDIEPIWFKDEPLRLHATLHTIEFYYDPVVTARYNRKKRTSPTVYIFVESERREL